MTKKIATRMKKIRKEAQELIKEIRDASGNIVGDYTREENNTIIEKLGPLAHEINSILITAHLLAPYRNAIFAILDRYDIIHYGQQEDIISQAEFDRISRIIYQYPELLIELNMDIEDIRSIKKHELEVFEKTLKKTVQQLYPKSIDPKKPGKAPAPKKDTAILQ